MSTMASGGNGRGIEGGIRRSELLTVFILGGITTIPVFQEVGCGSQKHPAVLPPIMLLKFALDWWCGRGLRHSWLLWPVHP